MSALPPKADIAKHYWHVRFVPIADIVPLKIFRAEIGWAGAESVTMFDETRSQGIQDAVCPHAAILARAPHAIHFRICTATDD